MHKRDSLSVIFIKIENTSILKQVRANKGKFTQFIEVPLTKEQNYFLLIYKDDL